MKYHITDVNKTNASKECDICYCWYFLDKVSKFPMYVCNDCHDLLMMYTDLVDIAILSINDVDYDYKINGFSKSEGVNLLQNADLSKKSKTLKNINFLTLYKN